MRDARMPPLAEIWALLLMLVRYWFTIAPTVGRELRRWEQRARRIPDPTLRAHATAKLRDERLNAQAAATFAALVPLRHRRVATRLMVGFEVMYDYLDAVSEQPVADPLANGRQLHTALIAAITQGTASPGYYRHHPTDDDGGYLEALVASCRRSFEQLPAAAVVAPVAVKAARRCGEAQTRTHAVAARGPAQLAQWASAHATDDLRWWEYAAGATASLALHALFAAAGDRRTSATYAALTDSSYHPYVGALATLLDSTIDHDSDAPDVDHRYVAYYPSDEDAASRLTSIALRAGARVARLRHGAKHRIVVIGIACFYLSSPSATAGFARHVRESVLGSIGTLRVPIIAVLRRYRTP